MRSMDRDLTLYQYILNRTRSGKLIWDTCLRNGMEFAGGILKEAGDVNHYDQMEALLATHGMVPVFGRGFNE